MRKFLSLLCFFAITFSVSACGVSRQASSQASSQNSVSNSSHAEEVEKNGQEQIPISSFAISENKAKDEDIVNLPTLLYVPTERTFAGYQGYDFFIDKITDLDITVDTKSGSLTIAIINKDTKEYILEETECGVGEYTSLVQLAEPGQYSVVFTMDNHSGYYKIAST